MQSTRKTMNCQNPASLSLLCRAVTGVAVVGELGRREFRARVHTTSCVVGPTWAMGMGGRPSLPSLEGKSKKIP